MSCEVCADNDAIERGVHPGAIGRLQSGYVKLPPTQYFRGYATFTAKKCVPELHDLGASERTVFLHEMAEVAAVLWRSLSPRKLNYELLGNGCAHLHWHLFPRFDSDPHPRGPVWEDLTFLRLLWSGEGRLPPAKHDALRRSLLIELRGADVEIEREYC